jgi:hypothetical protein
MNLSTLNFEYLHSNKKKRMLFGNSILSQLGIVNWNLLNYFSRRHTCGCNLHWFYEMYNFFFIKFFFHFRWRNTCGSSPSWSSQFRSSTIFTAKSGSNSFHKDRGCLNVKKKNLKKSLCWSFNEKYPWWTRTSKKFLYT